MDFNVHCVERRAEKQDGGVMDFNSIFNRPPAELGDGGGTAREPPGLSIRGKRAYYVFKEILAPSEAWQHSSFDNVAFYSPKMWRDAGGELSSKTVLLAMVPLGSPSDLLLSKSLSDAINRAGLSMIQHVDVVIKNRTIAVGVY